MPILMCCIAMGHFLVPALPIFGFGLAIGDRAIANGIGPELPPGPFFAIWGIIFTTYLIMAVWGTLRPNFVSALIVKPLTLAGLGNIIWMLSAQLIGLRILDFLLLLPILFFAWQAAYRLQSRTPGYDGTVRSILNGLTVGLLAGWLSVAVSISLPELVRVLSDRAVSDAVWQSLWWALGPAGIMAIAFTRFISRSLWYYVALGWGLLGIFWNVYFRLELHALGLFTLIVGLIIFRQRFSYRAE